MEEQYMSLVTDYIDGTLSDNRKREFETYVSEGHIDMNEVEAMISLQSKIEGLEEPTPSSAMSDNFYAMLSETKSASNKAKNGFGFDQVWHLLFGTNKGRLAFGMTILILGVVLGRGFTGTLYKSQLSELSTQMADMQEMMMMSMLEEESVTQRLKGVQMSSELVSSNREVTDAMFVTLNNDESTNVRMAALNLLAQYTDDPAIREGLIKSISQQDSPLMQVALAELMVELQESKAVNEFKSIIEGEYTPEEVKTTLRESLDKIM